jgi:uncharacterized membrane protein
METKSSRSLWQSIALGLIAGLRSASAGAVASHISRQVDLNKADNKFAKLLHSGGFDRTLKVVAIGELIADKLPFVPSRTKPAGLTARIISGGVSSAAVSKTNRKNAILYGLLGATVAAGATFAFYHLRKTASRKTGIADPLIALLEDAIVAGVGLVLMKTAKTSD